MKKILIASMFFTYGLIVGTFHIFPYDLIKDSYNSIKYITIGSQKNKNLKECSLPQSTKIISGSTIIIGHAYGRINNSTNYDYLTPKVENFLNEHRQNIDRVIFTGDVFYEPSLKKWNKLYQQFSSDMQVYVAPGNHDVGSLSSAEIFEMSKFGFKNSISIKDEPHLILEDSESNNGLLHNSTLDLIKNTNQPIVYLFRHHVPIIELLNVANSKNGKREVLPDADEFINKFTNIKSIVVVAGDSGGFPSLPRMTCNSYKNVTFITNGIGNVKDDIILVLINGRISYLKI